ncbi:MAG: PDZ domain-containing protein, partial [Syntrophomonadaceae bacterium]|nr:PDZ domain-containing protein [Syntrophomonadaceae bacterium]
TAQGIGFAIPADTVREVLDDLLQGNDIIRPFLGVSMRDINEETRQQLRLGNETRGILVVEVVKGTAAEKAGIKAMDIITDIDGEKISSAEQLQDIVSGHEVGDKINLNILRNGKALSFTANLQSKPSQ